MLRQHDSGCLKLVVYIHLMYEIRKSTQPRKSLRASIFIYNSIWYSITTQKIRVIYVSKLPSKDLNVLAGVHRILKPHGGENRVTFASSWPSQLPIKMWKTRFLSYNETCTTSTVYCATLKWKLPSTVFARLGGLFRHPPVHRILIPNGDENRVALRVHDLRGFR